MLQMSCAPTPKTHDVHVLRTFEPNFSNVESGKTKQPWKVLISERQCKMNFRFLSRTVFMAYKWESPKVHLQSVKTSRSPPWQGWQSATAPHSLFSSCSSLFTLLSAFSEFSGHTHLLDILKIFPLPTPTPQTRFPPPPHSPPSATQNFFSELSPHLLQSAVGGEKVSPKVPFPLFF